MPSAPPSSPDVPAPSLRPPLWLAKDDAAAGAARLVSDLQAAFGPAALACRQDLEAFVQVRLEPDARCAPGSPASVSLDPRLPGSLFPYSAIPSVPVWTRAAPASKPPSASSKAAGAPLRSSCSASCPASIPFALPDFATAHTCLAAFHGVEETLA